MLSVAVTTDRSQISADDRRALEALCGEDVRFDEPMSRHTTLKVGGPADAWCAPSSIEALVQVVELCATRDIPITAVGGGSNLLVRDGGVRGVVLASRNLRGLERRGETSVRVEAGVSTGKLLSMAIRWDLGGVEFLGGVPGSVGGGLVMNAGTYLGEFVDVTREVTSIRLTDGAIVYRDNPSCGFVYRGSDLPRDEIVVEAALDLFHRPAAEIRADVRALRDRRAEREPHKVNNAGSVFKNPEGDYAGRIIEAAGHKGLRVGGAECSPVHANWFVNTGGARAADFIELISIVGTDVSRRFGIDLKLEWKIIGED